MAPSEIIVGGAIAAIGTLAMVFHAVGRLDRTREQRERSRRSAAADVGDCFRIAAAIPAAYLPQGVRGAVATCATGLLARLRALSPRHPDMQALDARLQALTSDLAADVPATRPLLTPAQRRETSDGLRHLKGLLRHASRLALITRQECQRHCATIDGVLVRIVVDHLKTNAFNSEAKGRNDDAVRYMQRAIETLSTANVGGRHSQEIATLGKELARVQGVIREAVERRRAMANGPNELLRGVMAEAAREAAELKPAQYD
jgi:hypothetical protein